MTNSGYNNMTCSQKDQMISRLLHRLAMIGGDVEVISRHICRFDKDKIFKQPSLNKDGSVFADEAWHNISNIEIACDLNSDESLSWGVFNSKENKV